MQELLWHALSHGLTRPVPGQDVPLWFAALLALGLLCAGALIGLGMIQWSRSFHEKRARVRLAEKRSRPSNRGTGGTGAAAA
jgi:hypothetical protein